MEEEEIIDKLRTNLSAILICENLSDIYKINAFIFNLLAKLEQTNKTLADKISPQAVKISSLSDIKELHSIARYALTLFEKEKEEEGVFTGFRIVKIKDYYGALIKYSHLEAQIAKTEISIVRAIKPSKKLHDKIKRGKYKECLHAYVNDNTRIIYFVYYDQKKLVYIDIITKNDFDGSMRTKPIDWREKFKDL